METAKEDICCPKFEPELWHDKFIEWKNKPFLKDKICTFFYIPLNFGSVMRRLDKKVRNAGGTMPDNLCLNYHTSKWNMDVYLAVDKAIADADMENLNGKFYSRVYEGSFSDTGNWHKDFEKIAKEKNITTEKIYMWYTTCPKCAKKYGKNYVAFVAKVS